MKKFFAPQVSIFLLIIQLGFAVSLFAQNTRQEITVEEYNIYSAALKGTFVKTGTEELVLQNYTSALVAEKNTREYQLRIKKIFAKLQKAFPQLEQSTFDDILSPNRQKRSVLSDKFDLTAKTKVVSGVELFSKLFPCSISKANPCSNSEKGFFENFYKIYPRSEGWITLGTIGFNPLKTQALVFFSVYNRPQNFDTYYALIEKQDSWVFKSSFKL